MMEKPSPGTVDLEFELQPETLLEQRLLEDPVFRKGLVWGVPRYGHPEGEVYKHVREVLDNIERLTITEEERLRLRLIAYAHDTFKYLENKEVPRRWERHHAVLARRFLERYTDDLVVLTITQYHDEAYYIWRDHYLYQAPQRAEARMAHLLNRIGDHRQLYYYFFKCDTQTGDKNPAPLQWVEENFPGIQPVELK